MNKVKGSFRVSLLVFLLLAVPVLVMGADLKQIAGEFQPVSGYVVMSVNGEFLVDLDADDGLRVGDLLSVAGTPKKVVHPVSGKVIGSLEVPKAVLKVTRLDSGFSHARPMSSDADISQGDAVRRFAGLTAALYAPLDQGERVYDRLRDLLPELAWQGRFGARPVKGTLDEEIEMRFVLDREELSILDRHGKKLRSYELSTTSAEVAAAPAVSPMGSGTAPTQGSSPPGASASHGGVDFGDVTYLAEFPGQVQMAAFLRKDNRLLVATVTGSSVRVFEAGDRLRPVGATKVRDGAADPLAVGWWQPDPAGPLYVAVTAVTVIIKGFGNIEETRMDGAIYRLDDKALVPVATRVPFFLGTLDHNGDGWPETLMGQEFDWQQVYGRVFELGLGDGELTSRPPQFPLPDRFVLPGSAMGDLNGDGEAEVVTLSNRDLRIFSGRREVYQSSGQMGGTLASFTYDVNPGVTDTLFNTVSLEVPPAILDIDGDGVSELLTVASDTSVVRVPGVGPGINSSWISVVKFRKGMFQKGRLSFESEHPLQGLWVEAGQVYLVETQPPSLLSDEGYSKLLRIPLSSGRH